MFILRKVFPDGTELNVSLGETYQWIPKNSDSFKCYKDEFSLNNKGVILDYEENEFPVDNESKHYVMTESGQTFNRI